ncbi:peritrophin-1-like [Ochlerotatus camptorhynchus]|uniref:peritrophin-1-like n=1 Tax=Ochlerotatus camptorhynchus TaxID=644619 RepID=UPI0031D576E1
MKVQLCLAVLLNVVIHHASTSSPCFPENGPEDAEYHPHPTDCSKFFTCNWGAVIEQQCPPGTYWNDAIKACDFEANVNCELQPASSTPSSSSTAAAVSVAGKCPEEYDPSHEIFLPHVDCSKFYICTQHGAVEQSCPSGLHWNQNANVCDWPQAAGCTAGTINPLTTTTELPPAISTTSAAPSTPVGKCPEVYDPNDEVFLPHADCTKYYLCTWNGRPEEQSCPPGLHWNASANQCDWPALAGCHGTYLAVKGSELTPLVLNWEEFLSSMRHRLK